MQVSDPWQTPLNPCERGFILGPLTLDNHTYNIRQSTLLFVLFGLQRKTFESLVYFLREIWERDALNKMNHAFQNILAESKGACGGGEES